MAMNVGGSGGPKSDINITPLVDVVLVLLIIFMVITPLLAKQFWLHLPDKVDKQEQEASKNDKPPIVVFVNAAGEIDPAGGWLEYAVEHLEQCCLAGAVAADQS